MNPTGELREWWWLTFDHSMVRGRMYNHLVYEDGSLVTIQNINTMNIYKDHTFVITDTGDYYKLEHVHRNMNGI